MFYKNNLPNPSLSDFKSVYPKNKSNRNIYKLWRWLFIGRFSLLISWISARLNLHPNFITIISFITGLIGLFFIIKGGSSNIIIGVICINCWYLLDCSDGHLARYYKIKSNLGKFLDEIFGEIILTFLWFFLGYSFFLNPDKFMIYLSNYFYINNYIFIFGAVASISIPLRNCVSVRFSNCYIDKKNNLNSNDQNKDKKYSLYGLIKLFFINLMGIGGLLGPFLILFAIFDYLSLLLIIYSILYFSYLVLLILYFIHRLKI
ncbi:CDP-alcohol phosphatidyltransferase family protein [Candidatus Marinimicrobia bacterium]|nr:CDP-alcohol phosphatidyltransferase family protein [Candidatus Neomarinimicrobiota bacterium]